MRPHAFLLCCVWILSFAPISAVESPLEDFATATDLRLGGQLLQPESALRFAAGPTGGREAVLAFRFIPLNDGIPTVGIQFPPKSRVIFRQARRLLVAVRGDRAGVPLRVTLRDRSDELHMYQLEPTPHQGPGGSTIYATAIDRAGFFCWGGDGNKKPDYPLSLDQLFLDGNGTTGANGAVSFASISCDAERENRPSQAGAPVLLTDFSAADAVLLGGDHLDPASRLLIAAVDPLAHAAKLHFRFPAAVPGGQTCGVRFATALALNGPLQRLLIPVRGDAGRQPIRVNVFDAHNELHMFTCEQAVADAAPQGFRWLAVDFAKAPLFVAGGDGDHLLQWPARLDLLFIDGGASPESEGDLVIGPLQVIPDADAPMKAASRPTKPFLLQRCERLMTDASTWGDKAQPAARLSCDHAQKFEGDASLCLDYHFAAVDTGQAAFYSFGEHLPEGTTRLRAAVRSEGHARQIHATLIDADGKFDTVTLGVAPADQWQSLSADLTGHTLAWPVTWRDVLVAREPGKPDVGRVWIDAIGADLPDAPAEHLSAALDLGCWPPLCWGIEHPPHGSLVITGAAEDAATLPVTVTLYDHHRRYLGTLWSGQATAKVGAPFRQPLSWTLPGFGVYELDIRLGERTTLHSFSWLPQRSTQWPEGPFGVNATPQWLLDAMAGIGMAWNRAEYGWRLVEHRPGVYEDAAFAGPQAAAAAAGMRTLMLIGDWGPQQCLGAGKAPDASALYDGYARYCAWMAATNSGPQTRHFQIWNEPNLGGFWWPKPDVGNYATTLLAAYPAIKAADPQAQVVGLNVSCIDLPFVDEVLKRGGGKAMDVIALHPYHLPEAPERFKRAVPSPTLGGEFPPGTFLEQMGKLCALLDLRGAGQLKLWLDEYGYADRTDLYPEFAHDEWRAAALLVRQSLLALSIPRVERLFAYNARDVATGQGGNWDNATGFLRSDGSPKARFATWATMTRMLHQRRCTRSLTLPANAYAYEFAGAAGPVLAAWCGDGAQTLSLRGAGASPTLTDSMGNTLVLIPRAGVVTIGLSEEPVYLAGWNDATPVENTIAVHSDLRCAPGESLDLVVPSAKSLWTLDAPAGWLVKTVAIGRFILTPDASAMTGLIPLRLAGDGISLGVTLTYDDSIRVRACSRATGVELTLQNPYATARRVTLSAQRDKTMVPAITTVAAPRSLSSATIPLSTETGAGYTTIPLLLSAQMAPDESASPVVLVSGQRLVFAVTPCPALVAGAPTGKPCLLDQPYQCVSLKPGKVYDPSDLSGSFRCGWDAKHLRIELRMTDDEHRPQSDAAALWKGDSLQFAVLVGGVRHEFDVAIPAAGGQALTWRRAPSEGPADGLIASGTRSGTLTTYTVDVPWSLIDLTKPDASDIRFALLVNDDDGAGRHGWVEWCEGIGMTKDAERWGPLLLGR